MRKRMLSFLLAGVVAVMAAACGAADEKKDSAAVSTEKAETKKEISALGSDAKDTQTADSDAAAQSGSGDAQPAQGEGRDDSGTDGTGENTEKDSTAREGTVARADDSDPDEGEGRITEDQAQKVLESVFGTEDEDTGYPFSFQYLGTFSLNGGEYYGYTMYWEVENSHLSKLTDILVKTDGTGVYQGVYDGAEWSEVNYEDNQMK